jgi:hypothetical protein
VLAVKVSDAVPIVFPQDCIQSSEAYSLAPQVKIPLVTVFVFPVPHFLATSKVGRRVQRDVKAVHSDVHALLDAGVLEHSREGVVFPYDAVHVDFMFRAAA